VSTQIPEGSVIITPVEVYREMQNMSHAIQGISTKLDVALTDNNRRVETLEKDSAAQDQQLRRLNDTPQRIEDHEGRIRGLERWKWGVGGTVTLVSSGAAALVAKLVAGH
jgi:hypothetical protein